MLPLFQVLRPPTNLQLLALLFIALKYVAPHFPPIVRVFVPQVSNVALWQLLVFADAYIESLNPNPYVNVKSFN